MPIAQNSMKSPQAEASRNSSIIKRASKLRRRKQIGSQTPALAKMVAVSSSPFALIGIPILTKSFGSSSEGEYHDHVSHVKRVAGLSIAIIAFLAAAIFHYAPLDTKYGTVFAILFGLRYLRFVVNNISWILACPYPPPEKPTLTPKDVTVVIPSANPEGDEFRMTVESALDSGAEKVIIVTFNRPGNDNMAKARRSCEKLFEEHGDRLSLLDNGRGDKREQMMLAVKHTSSDVTVFWTTMSSGQGDS